MKTSKRLLGLLLALSLLLSVILLTGCGNDKETATDDEAVVVSATPDSAQTTDSTLPSETLSKDHPNGTEKQETATTEVDNNSSPTEKNTGKTNTAATEAKTDRSGSSNSGSASSTSSGGSSSSRSSGSSISSQPSGGSAYSRSSGGSSSSKPSGSTASKTWHEAEYEFIEHPAETKEEWVIDQEAYSYEVPDYEYQGITICNQCGADITYNLMDHFKANEDTCWSYRNTSKKVQIGSHTVDVPEKGHWETIVIKEAWTEKKVIREAGYY